MGWKDHVDVQMAVFIGTVAAGVSGLLILQQLTTPRTAAGMAKPHRCSSTGPVSPSPTVSRSSRPDRQPPHRQAHAPTQTQPHTRSLTRSTPAHASAVRDPSPQVQPPPPGSAVQRRRTVSAMTRVRELSAAHQPVVMAALSARHRDRAEPISLLTTKAEVNKTVAAPTRSRSSHTRSHPPPNANTNTTTTHRSSRSSKTNNVTNNHSNTTICRNKQSLSEVVSLTSPRRTDSGVAAPPLHTSSVPNTHTHSAHPTDVHHKRKSNSSSTGTHDVTDSHIQWDDLSPHGAPHRRRGSQSLPESHGERHHHHHHAAQHRHTPRASLQKGEVTTKGLVTATTTTTTTTTTSAPSAAPPCAAAAAAAATQSSTMRAAAESSPASTDKSPSPQPYVEARNGDYYYAVPISTMHAKNIAVRRDVLPDITRPPVRRTRGKEHADRRTRRHASHVLDTTGKTCAEPTNVISSGDGSEAAASRNDAQTGALCITLPLTVSSLQRHRQAEEQDDLACDAAATSSRHSHRCRAKHALLMESIQTGPVSPTDCLEDTWYLEEQRGLRMPAQEDVQHHAANTAYTHALRTDTDTSVGQGGRSSQHDDNCAALNTHASVVIAEKELSDVPRAALGDEEAENVTPRTCNPHGLIINEEEEEVEEERMEETDPTSPFSAVVQAMSPITCVLSPAQRGTHWAHPLPDTTPTRDNFLALLTASPSLPRVTANDGESRSHAVPIDASCESHRVAYPVVRYSNGRAWPTHSVHDQPHGSPHAGKMDHIDALHHDNSYYTHHDDRCSTSPAGGKDGCVDDDRRGRRMHGPRPRRHSDAHGPSPQTASLSPVAAGRTAAHSHSLSPSGGIDLSQTHSANSSLMLTQTSLTSSAAARRRRRAVRATLPSDSDGDGHAETAAQAEVGVSTEADVCWNVSRGGYDTNYQAVVPSSERAARLATVLARSDSAQTRNVCADATRTRVPLSCASPSVPPTRAVGIDATNKENIDAVVNQHTSSGGAVKHADDYHREDRRTCKQDDSCHRIHNDSNSNNNDDYYHDTRVNGAAHAKTVDHADRRCAERATARHRPCPTASAASASVPALLSSLMRLEASGQMAVLQQQQPEVAALATDLRQLTAMAREIEQTYRQSERGEPDAELHTVAVSTTPSPLCPSTLLPCHASGAPADAGAAWAASASCMQ